MAPPVTAATPRARLISPWSSLTPQSARNRALELCKFDRIPLGPQPNWLMPSDGGSSAGTAASTMSAVEAVAVIW